MMYFRAFLIGLRFLNPYALNTYTDFDSPFFHTDRQCSECIIRLFEGHALFPPRFHVSLIQKGGPDEIPELSYTLAHSYRPQMRRNHGKGLLIIRPHIRNPACSLTNKMGLIRNITAHVTEPNFFIRLLRRKTSICSHGSDIHFSPNREKKPRIIAVCEA